jgi:hypothetical protein
VESKVGNILSAEQELIPERNAIDQGWPNLLNVRATYAKLQMFESRKTRTNITHTFLLLHAHFVTKTMYIELTL